MIGKECTETRQFLGRHERSIWLEKRSNSNRKRSARSRGCVTRLDVTVRILVAPWEKTTFASFCSDSYLIDSLLINGVQRDWNTVHDSQGTCIRFVYDDAFELRAIRTSCKRRGQAMPWCVKTVVLEKDVCIQSILILWHAWPMDTNLMIAHVCVCEGCYKTELLIAVKSTHAESRKQKRRLASFCRAVSSRSIWS